MTQQISASILVRVRLGRQLEPQRAAAQAHAAELGRALANLLELEESC